MRVSGYVRIYPHGHARMLLEFRGSSGQRIDFGGAFKVKQQNASLERGFHLGDNLANAREHDSLTGGPAHATNALQFAA